MSGQARLWRRKLSAQIERAPHLYRTMMLFRYRNGPFLRRIVSSGHDIVIEGFPRCANSFANSAFLLANGWWGARVATHVHSPAQVVLAARCGVPTILNIRTPSKAVPAFMAFAGKFNRVDAARLSVAEKRAWVHEQTARFARFYETTNPLHASYVLATFQQTTTDFGVVIDRVNETFGQDFERFDHTPENIKKIFDRKGEHLSPDAHRDTFKAEYAEIYAEAGNRGPRGRAEAAYFRALQLSGIAVPD
jgi:hypothetical protein